MRALSAAPLTTLAQVARLQPEELRSRLVDAGLRPTSDAQSVADLAGSDVRKQVRVMAKVFTPAK